MIRIVVIGSECTGKTTLAVALATHYGTVAAPEFARRFVVEKGAAPEYADVEAIARGQITLEDEQATAAMAASASSPSSACTAPALLVCDTDLLSTVVFSNHYYGECPAWIDSALRARPADLYLLAGTDVPWIPDGNQRDRGDRRAEMQELFRRALASRGLRYLELSGGHDERLAAAISAVDSLLTRCADR